MSIRNRTFSTSLLVAALLMLPPASAAAQTEFKPYITLQQTYTDNVGFAGTIEESDSVTSLSVALPVTRTWKTGSYSFRYEPTIERFDEFEDFDHTAHRATFRLQSSPSEVSSFNVDAGYDRTQDQGQASSLEDSDLFLTQRAVRESIRAGFGYDGMMGQRWNWSATARVADTRYDEEDLDPGATSTLEDRTTYAAGARFGRATSRISSIGFGYELRQFDLEQDDETSHLLSFNLRREVGRKLGYDLSAGGFYSEGAAAEGPGGEDDDSRTGFQVAFGLRREFKNSQLRLDLDHRPTDGGSLQGTSTNSTFGLSYAGTISQGWFWGSSARYTRRDPSDDDAATLDTVAIGGWLERGFLRTLALRLTSDYSDQSSDDPTQDGSFFNVGLGLVYYPLGRTQATR